MLNTVVDKVKKNKILTLLVMIIFLTYIRLPQQFFLQDEWHHLGQEYAWHNQGSLKFFSDDIFSPIGLRFLPLAYAANYLQFSFFKINPTGYAFVSLALHILNTILVYMFVLKLTGNKFLSLSASTVFGVNIAHLEAITWLIQHTTTVFAAFFSLLSLLKYLDFIKTNKNSDIFFTIVFFISAIFFKETSFFLVLLIPLLNLILVDRSKDFLFKNRTVLLLIFFSLCFCAVLIKFAGLSGFQKLSSMTLNFSTMSRRVVTVPLRVLAQDFLPVHLFKFDQIKHLLSLILHSKTLIFGTTEFDTFFENYIVKWSMYVIALTILIICGNLYKRLLVKKSESTAKNLLVGVLIIVTASFPLIFVNLGNFLFVPGRYLYIPSIGAGIVIGCFLSIFKSQKIRIVLLIAYALVSIFFIQKRLNEQIKLGNLRRNILGQIKNDYPYLPKNPVFYLESDSSYYGLPVKTHILPFQSGLGQTLLVWYQESEQFPNELLEENYFWNIDSQGYKQVGKSGFGYYRDLNLLLNDLKKNNITPESVIGYKWIGKSQELINTTDAVREEIEKNEKTVK